MEVTARGDKDLSLTGRAAWMLFAKTLAFAFSFALPLLLVRRFSQQEFGLYKQIFLFVNTAYMLLPLGVGMSAFYFLPREPERQPQVVLNILLFHLLVSGVACLGIVLNPSFLGVIFNNPEIIQYALLIGLVVLTWVASASLEVIPVANQELKLATLFVVLAQFTKAAFLLTAAILFGTVKSLLYAALIQGSLQTLILIVYLNSRFKGFARSFEWGMVRTQLAYALPFGFASILFRAQADLDKYFVSYRLGSATFAIYAVGCFELPLIGILSDAITSVTIPRISYLQKFGDRREIAELIVRMMRKLAAIFFPLHAFLLIMGSEFLIFLFTKQYLASWPIFAINLTLIPLAIITSAYDPVTRAYAELRYFLIKIRIVLLVLLLLSLWFTTQRFGMLGAIASMICVNTIERLVIARRVTKTLGMTRRDLWLFKDIGKLFLAVTSASLVTVVVRSLVNGAKPFFMLLICGLTFSFIYLLMIWLIGILTPEERSTIRLWLVRLQRLSQWNRA
jgi:O-antigen/teichoic acid export membrane protein